MTALAFHSGISIMLAYSVFSLRLSEDVPSQSDSVHLISLYLTVCMFFSLSAMTWFAIVNKLRERKRLPYWIRWFALDYISWIVFARNMHNKAVRAVKQEQLKTACMTASTTPIVIPMQHVKANRVEYANNYYIERDSLSTGTSVRMPLLPCKSSQTRSTFEQITSLPSSSTDDGATASSSKSTVWIRQRSENIPTQPTSANGRSHKRTAPMPTTTVHAVKAPRDHSATRNTESIYAIHIYNRLVFLIFLVVVISINVYTWFFYSRTVKTKLFDTRTPWSCFDEALLEIVNCSYPA